MELWLTFLRGTVETMSAFLSYHTSIDLILAEQISGVVVMGSIYLGIPAAVIYWAARPIKPKTLLKDIGAYRRGIINAEKLLDEYSRPTSVILEQALIRVRGGYFKYAYSIPCPATNSVRFFFFYHVEGSALEHIDIPCNILSLDGLSQEQAIINLLRSPTATRREVYSVLRKAAA